MKTLKFFKYEVIESIPYIRTYYAIIIFLLALLAVLHSGDGITFINISAVESATVIFLFIGGLNGFREDFNFAQANHLSRKTFFKGAVLSIFPITFAMSIIDIGINRILNLFFSSPAMYDIFYGSARHSDIFYKVDDAPLWTQASTISHLFGTFLWQFALYNFAVLLGLLITIVYYRSNRIIRIAALAALIMFVIFIRFNPVGKFISFGMTRTDWNPYIDVLNMAIISAVFCGFIYLLTRRAVADV